MPWFHADGKTSTEAEAVAMNGAERENHRCNAAERAGRIDATELHCYRACYIASRATCSRLTLEFR